jgi:predicted ABC-type transport system involved in lysophospholipase L1 biosynthesis ATPase subunit
MLSGIDRPTSGSIRIGEHLIHELDENGLARWRGRNLGSVQEAI